MLKRTISITISCIIILSGFCASAAGAEKVTSEGTTADKAVSTDASADSSAKTIPVSVQGSYLRVDAMARNFSEGMIGVYNEQQDKSGFIDMEGNEVIACEYNYVNSFHEGLAFASLTPGTGGYIDYTGQFIIPPVYAWGSDFRGGKAIVSTPDNTYQIINTKGENLLSAKYKSVYYDETAGRYIAITEDGKTNILTGELAVEKTFPVEIDYIQRSGGKTLAVSHTDSYSMSVMDYDTGKTILTGEDYAFVSFINGLILFSSEEKQRVQIYNLDGKLLHTFEDIIYVYPINENIFHYFDPRREKYFIWESGKEKQVDFQISQAALPGLLVTYTSIPDQNPRFGVINAKGEMALSAKYDSINTAYYEYGSGSEKKSRVFMALSGSTCEVYDENCRLVRTFENIKSVGRGYVIDQKGFATILDENGNDVTVVDTGARGDIYGSFDDMFFLLKDGKQTTYIYTENGIDKKGEYSYEPVKMTDPSANMEKEISFFTIDGVKRSANGVVSLQGDWFPKLAVEKDRTMIYPYFLNVIFPRIGSFERDTYSEVYSGASSVQLQYNDMSAEITSFDFKAGKPVKTTISLEVPAKKMNTDVDGYKGDVPFIPLRAACEALGYHVYWNDGLIGISNKPITLSEQEAFDIKASLTDNLFSPQQFKRLDASLATQPYVDALVKKTLKVDEVYYNLPEYTNTIPGYEALINKEKDIILVTEPSKDILELAASKGVELEITPFAKEGFVFLLNKSNPVDELTVQQLKDIYSGKITNWKEVGGHDAPIIAYQRNQSSGSQTIMENVFMKDEKLMEPIVERRIMSMAGLVDVIAEFKGDVNNSIGYSVYYYATQMYGNDMVKLVKADGIAPNSDTIKDGTYPAVVNYYIVTRKGDQSQFVKELTDYILSDEGQKILEDVGLVPVN